MNILLAEDDERLGKLIVHMLKKEKHTVDWVTNGRDAFNYAIGIAYDLLILDWMMPHESGVTVCHKLRDGGYNGAILLLTARDALDDRVTGLDAGADDYLLKPFAFAELFARIRALGRRTSSVIQDETITVADLTLHTGTRKVYRNNKEIYLTPKEFQLLELLMRNNGHVMSRDILIDRIWGYDADVTNNNLDAFLRLLRKKIDQAGKQKLIHTVRGIGYTLEA